MSEILVETTPTETVIELGDGTVLETTVSEEVQTIVVTPGDPVVVDLNSGPRGEPGDKIYTGDGYPDVNLGAIGDLYIITGPPGSIGNVYRKTPTGWSDEGNIRGPAGGINTVNGYVGPNVILSKDDIYLDQVDNTSDLDKPVSNAAQSILDQLGIDKAEDSVVVKLTGAQTIAGVKTFSSTPVVADASWTIAKTNGLQAALDGKALSGHIHALADVTGLVAALAGKEATLAAGTIGQYYRGDKTWQTLDKAAVGLPNVANAAQVELTGNQTISGTKTFSSAVIVGTPTANNHAATKLYIDTAINNLVNSAPGLLDTLDELAAALGDDPNFATTVTNSINDTNAVVATKEPVINAGTTAQYWRGDKSWQTLNPTAVGLGNVANAAQVDLASAQNIAGVKTFTVAPVVPDNSFAIAKTSGLQTALNAKEATIAAGTTSQYWRGDKSWQTLDKAAVGLPAVSNDAQVTVSTAQTITGAKTFDVNATIASARQIVFADARGAVADPTGLDLGSVFGNNAAGSPANMRIKLYSNTYGFGVSASKLEYHSGSGAAHSFYSGGSHQMTISGLGALSVVGAVTAPSFIGSGASLTALNASNLGSGSVPQARIAQNITRVEHGATAGTARPATTTYVEWVGSVQPTNMASGDTWINTTVNGNTTDLYPSGVLLATASSKTSASSGFYFSEGQQILISGDTSLYNELTNNGTVFPYGTNTNGSGAAGSTHFRLPDMRGKVIAHVDGTTEFASIGTVFGAKTVTLTSAQIPSHTHPITDPTHYHDTYGRGSTWQANDPWGGTDIYFAVNAVGGYPNVGGSNYLLMGSAWHDTYYSATGITVNGNTGGGGSHNNVQPTMSLRYMIKR